jgi:hypothetical protein
LRKSFYGPSLVGYETETESYRVEYNVQECTKPQKILYPKRQFTVSAIDRKSTVVIWMVDGQQCRIFEVYAKNEIKKNLATDE